jgi:asparagine synthase (glutamine-hydrolysing)
MAAIAAFVSASDAPADAAAVRRLVWRPPFDDHARVRLSIEGGIAVAAAWRGDACAFASCAAVQVVCDGRLDDRDTLRAALHAAGHDAPADATAATLVAAAYAAFGIRCFERLTGEFAACVWDETRRTVIAARDRFGIKPLFHAAAPGGWVVASSLAALRGWPGVSSRLSDGAIGDLLVCGGLQDPEATCFEDVARVRPGGYAAAGIGHRTSTAAYFTLRIPEPPHYRRVADYVDDFRGALATAVRERLEGGKVSVMMSGGLDSSGVAAMATEPGGVAPADCLAVTAVYDSLFADEERRTSSLVAQFLGIGIEHVAVDGYDLFSGWDAGGHPEPTADVLSAIYTDLLRVAGRHAAVALTGDGGDPTLLPGAVVRHVGRVGVPALCRGIWRTVRRGLWPPLGLRSGFVRQWSKQPPPPAWLSTRLRAGYDPAARWKAFRDSLAPRPEPRGEALAVLSLPEWPQSFEAADPNTTGVPVEVRYPFFDARLLTLALSLPSYPWCVDKTVMREAMIGRLPEQIRMRPKSPLAGDPVRLRAWPVARFLEVARSTPGLDAYVDLDALAGAARDEGLLTDHQPGTLAVAALASWLRSPSGATAVPS